METFRQVAQGLIKEIEPPRDGGPPPLRDYISTSVRMTHPTISPSIGVDTLQWAILQATGLAKRIDMPAEVEESDVDRENIPGTTTNIDKAD